MASLTNPCENGTCTLHFHSETDLSNQLPSRQASDLQLLNQPSIIDTRTPSTPITISALNSSGEDIEKPRNASPAYSKDDRGIRRIIKNFTPS